MESQQQLLVLVTTLLHETTSILELGLNFWSQLHTRKKFYDCILHDCDTIVDILYPQTDKLTDLGETLACQICVKLFRLALSYMVHICKQTGV